MAQDVTDQIADALQAASKTQPVPVNMYEANDALVVVAAMPGVMPDDIELHIDGDRLVIRAGARTMAPKAYLRHEWHYGPYERDVDIPEGFVGPAQASFGNGQLAIRIERTGERLDRIPINAASDAASSV